MTRRVVDNFINAMSREGMPFTVIVGNAGWI